MPDFQFPPGAGGGGGSSSTPELSFLQEVIIPSVAGKNRYTIPVGNYFLDKAGETALDLDQGAGFISQQYGPDYSHLRRGFGNPAFGVPATVADAAIGFDFAHPVSAGWTFRFRWYERRILISPMPIGKVKYVAGVPDYTTPWIPTSIANAPNGVVVPKLTGYAVEFWRESFKNGGKRGTLGVLRRDGRRYVPYFRGAVDVFTFPRTTFAPLSVFKFKRKKYKVCYYNPLTGARSSLSEDTIQIAPTNEDRTISIGTMHVGKSVWII